jgi:phenylpropionate dioxygenase-like ring-hydroxylating dioxygenase large terminal subunit
MRDTIADYPENQFVQYFVCEYNYKRQVENNIHILLSWN